MADTQPRLVRFGPFVADLQTGELRKDEVKLRISGQPFQVLAFLLERAGEVVTREELQKRLWPDTFVDVDHNLNTAVNKIREALGDSAESPRYVETLPRRGYRFIGPLRNVDVDVSPPEQLTDAIANPPSKSKGRRWIYAGVAMLGAAVLIAALWRSAFPAKSLPRVVGFRQLTQDGQGKGWMTTDGSRIYFNEVMPGGAYGGVFQVPVEGGEVTPLPVRIKQPVLLDFSADTAELLIKSASDNSLWLQPIAGGSPKPVTGGVLFAGFGPGSRSILYGDANNVYSITRDGQTSHKLFSFEAETYPFYFRMLPDGKTFRFSKMNQPNGTNEIVEASTDGTGLHTVLSGLFGEWTRDGRYFVFNGHVPGQLAVQAWPRKKGFWSEPAEEPTPLTSGPLEFQYPLPANDGKEIYAVGNLHRAEVMRYDSRSGQFVQFLPGISAQGLAFSKDGQWVTYSAYPDGSLWRCKIDGSERLQLTFPPARTLLPRWSPDGTQIAYSASTLGANWNVYLIPRDGGIPHRILPSEQSQVDANWSPDGKLLVFASQQVSKASISIFDLRTKAVSILPGSMGLHSPHWSPDGRYIAAISTSDPVSMLFDFSTQQWSHLTDVYIDNPIWSHDGTSIYFESGDNSDRKIIRFALKDRKTTLVATIKGLNRVVDGDYFWGWAGLSPDDSPLITRNLSSEEIYALQMEWP